MSENNKSLYCHSVLDTESRGGDEVAWIPALARMTFSDTLSRWDVGLDSGFFQNIRNLSIYAMYYGLGTLGTDDADQGPVSQVFLIMTLSGAIFHRHLQNISQ
jgi:hypothetical protein